MLSAPAASASLGFSSASFTAGAAVSLEAARPSVEKKLGSSGCAALAAAPCCGAPPCTGGRSTLVSPGGLAWVPQLPHYVQGYLAACTTALEALEVLDEALDGLPPQPRPTAAAALSCSFVAEVALEEASLALSSAAVPASAGGPPSEPRGARQVQAQRFVRAEVDLVEASAELLKEAQARAAGLEEELQERQRSHELKIAELQRRHRRERKKMLHRLLDRLSPPRRPVDNGHVPDPIVAAVGPLPRTMQPAAPPQRRWEHGARIRSRSEGSYHADEADTAALVPSHTDVVTQPGVCGVSPRPGWRTLVEDKKRTPAVRRC